MDIDVLESRLRAMGYNREDSWSSETNYKTVIDGDYSHRNINHTVSSWSTLKNTNFDYAAATGSIYTKCKFINCSMYQTDFEFCDFHDCDFTSDEKVLSSFNGSNFVKTSFIDITFESCTFTSVYFEECFFSNVKIVSSTLENAFFQKCIFEKMDLRDLNMDYVQIENPLMSQVVLPFAQIPYMFGCLQYLHNTSNEVSISATKGGIISKIDYLEKALPLLIEYWRSKLELRPEFYFPLSNVYIANKDFIQASDSLKKGLQAAVIRYDYRMIKYYSKLISASDMFGKNWAHQFYKWIHVFMPNVSANQLAARGFMRNIGEIKMALFSSNKKPTLTIQIMSSLHLGNTDNIGKILGHLFSIAKMKDSIHPNEVELVLSENSPLLITSKILGEENVLLFLLPLLMQVANVQPDEITRLIPPALPENNTAVMCNTRKQAKQLMKQCDEIGERLSLMEYYLENCQSVHSLGITTHYCNISGLNNLHEQNLSLLSSEDE